MTAREAALIAWSAFLCVSASFLRSACVGVRVRVWVGVRVRVRVRVRALPAEHVRVRVRVGVRIGVGFVAASPPRASSRARGWRSTRAPG